MIKLKEGQTIVGEDGLTYISEKNDSIKNKRRML